MKRILSIISAALLFAVSFNASATIAYPYPIKVVQPDGSVITIQMHGDENFHWVTSDGKVVEKAPDGYYRAVKDFDPSHASTRFELARRDGPQKVSGRITNGENHFLVILVEFQDLAFTVSNPQQAFYNMLNESGYSANGGTGSVKDYYTENSAGKFQPTFDVYGPVKVSKNYSYYGSNSGGGDSRPQLAFWEACNNIDSQVDFSDYDIDGDGTVDNIFFYYAGHNEAEGAGSNYIWPHSSNLAAAKNAGIITGSIVFDGKTLGNYACTSEYKGSSGNNMCGIGTFCHEYGHVLGLPDFYDTDYDTNGQAEYGMGAFSLMSSGNYNHSGCTPPALTAVERQIIGWLEDIPEWTEAGVKEVPDIMENVAFCTGTATEGEFFVYETRGGSVWDYWINKSGAAAGLLIYHVDKSNNRISGKTAASLWSLSSNKLNAYASHPCCQPEPSGGSFSSAPAKVTYPGSGNVTSFNESSPSPMIDWSGNSTGRSITDIKYDGISTTLTFGLSSGKKVTGTVKDVDGNPVVGASVVLAPAESAKKISGKTLHGKELPMRSIRLGKAAGTGYTATISEDGTFAFDLEGDSTVDFTLTVSCYGYMDYVSSFRLTVGNAEKDVVLQKNAVLSDETEYQRYDGDIDYSTSFGEPLVAAIRYPAEELASAVGSQMTSITSAINGGITLHEARLIVDFGDETVLNLLLDNPTPGYYLTEDISSYDIFIPSGKDVYVGIYIDAESDDYPFLYNSAAAGKNGFFVRYLDDHDWEDFSDEGSIVMAFTLKPVFTQPYAYGYNGIANPKDGEYAAGEAFELKLVESAMVPDSVDWFFDGEAVEGSSVNVPEGEHVVKAILHFASGRTETIEQIIFGS